MMGNSYMHRGMKIFRLENLAPKIFIKSNLFPFKAVNASSSIKTAVFRASKAVNDN